MSATERVIGTDQVRVSADGRARIEVRLPWYRSLAPSTVEGIAVQLGGQIITPKDLVVSINGVPSDLNGLRDRWQETWFVQDTATVSFPAPETLDDSTSLDVAVTLRIPYIMTGPDTALTRTTREARFVSVVREDQP